MYQFLPYICCCVFSISNFSFSNKIKNYNKNNDHNKKNNNKYDKNSNNNIKKSITIKRIKKATKITRNTRQNNKKIIIMSVKSISIYLPTFTQLIQQIPRYRSRSTITLFFY